MRIEEQAIDCFIKLEPALRRTPEGNPGYDLYESGPTGTPIRWVEVKSMTVLLLIARCVFRKPSSITLVNEERRTGSTWSSMRRTPSRSESFEFRTLLHTIERSRSIVAGSRSPGRSRRFEWGSCS
ncbi:MAG: hypothetical protein WCH04_06555 [Gammaproteobacteria bacterium]